MRATALVPVFAACTADQPDCGSGMHEQGGECVADLPDDTEPEVGNDVDLDSFPPVVVRTLPANGALRVDPAVTELEVEFSRRMEIGQNFAWWTVDAYAPEGDGTAIWTDDTTNVLTGLVLEPDRAYHLWVNDPFGDGDSFHDPGGRSALEYPFVFATGEEPALLADFETAVVASTPVAGTEDVDPALARLEVSFGKDMDPSSSDWVRDTRETFPEILSQGFSDLRTAYADVVLEPSTTYALWIDGFVDTDGNLAAPWLLTFRTAD